jgi:uncharacterized short protein YbdD (DUF466 family)
MGAGLILKYAALIWRWLRQMSGDDAYERYLMHFESCSEHQSGKLPLSRKAFFKQWQDGKWNGNNRCC